VPFGTSLSPSRGSQAEQSACFAPLDPDPSCENMGLHISNILIVGITPYFLEKGNFWFEENLKKLLTARKTQAFFQDNTLLVEKDQEYNLSEFLRELDELGYEKVLEVDNVGEFSQRGGAVDVFPINMNTAIRFDFVGNKIESIEQLATTIEDEEKAKELLKRKLKSQKTVLRS